MSTIAPPSKPLNPALVDSEHYIDAQIRRTRRSLKLVDLAAGLITLAIGLFAFVLLAAVLDHWVVPGGLSELGRMAVFGLMLVALAWYGWRQFIPLLRPINPVYAAHTIERHTPSLKNSLLNLLWFRTHRQPMSTRVYHALEQQAAQRLSSAPIDTSVDRSALLRLGYALLAIVAVCAIYAVLSPKDMAVSAARVLAPWSDLAAPSRVQIVDIKPGETSVARGEQLEISAEIHGLRDDERVRIRYSTLDEQTVDQSAPMKLPDANARRFQGELPRRGSDASEDDAGVQQDLVYWIEAGDARSRKYKVNVFTRPTIIVQKVRYDYPAYTGFPSNETESTGDIRGIEGTTVTISALANKPIKNAYIDFDADGTSDLRMDVDGTRATKSFLLALREDRRTPTHVSYLLRFTSTEGRTNIDPPKYRIDVTPDYAPEIRITTPEEPELTVRVDEMLPIGVEARDPDFALAGVRLVGKVKNREATLAELLAARHEGRFDGAKQFTPGDAQLKPGDVLEYWAEARDNRRPDANIALSEHRRLRIAGPANQPPPNGQQQQQPGGQQPQDGQQQNGGNAQDGEQGQAGEQGNNGQGQEGDQQNGQNDGGENPGQQGAGGAGGQGQQNDQSQDQQGAGGQGQNGQAQPNDAQQQNQQGGGAGGENSQQADQQNGQQQPQNGANNGANSGQSDGNQQQQPNQQPQPGSQGGSQSNNAEGESASADGQEQKGGQQQQQKVSSQGDDDSTALRRMMEHLNQQNGQEKPDSNQQQQAQPNEAGQQPGGQDAAQQDQQQGAQADANQTNQSQGQQPAAAQQNEGQPASRTQGQQGSANPSQQQGQPNQQEGADGEPASAGGQPQTAANQSGQQNQGSPPDKSTGPAGASETNPQQKPAAEGAQSNEPRQPAGDAQQQAQGQRNGERQGSDTPRESKPGDGNPNDQQSAQQPSAETSTSNNQSDAGAGHNSDKQEGSGSANDKRAADKQDDGDKNQKLMDNEESPMNSPDKKESDSEGGQSGDRSGGGQDGGGQHADAPGKGAPGQNEAADTGGGRADEQGEGETGTKAGDQQLADGQTGQSSGDKKGQGSQKGEAGESATGEQPDGENAQTKPQAKPGEPGAKSGEGAAAPGQAGEQLQAGAQPGDQSQQPQNNQSGQQPPSDQPGGGQAGSAQPQGGGQGSAALSSQPPPSDQQQADEANLKFAQEQTNLVLESLDQQLAKKQVDQNLLKNLGWSEQELQQFVNRWKNLKARAESEGDKGEARAELDDALRSLGLRKQEPTRANVRGEADKLRVNDSFRARAPIEYADRVRAYSKNVASEK